MHYGSNCDRKSQLSEILTEPLNPRERCPCHRYSRREFPIENRRKSVKGFLGYDRTYNKLLCIYYRNSNGHVIYSLV